MALPRMANIIGSSHRHERRNAPSTKDFHVDPLD
jgi:hypothetical protein